jgi:hypothetical protein
MIPLPGATAPGSVPDVQRLGRRMLLALKISAIVEGAQ